MKYLKFINLHLCVLVPTFIYFIRPDDGRILVSVWLVSYALLIYFDYKNV